MVYDLIRVALLLEVAGLLWIQSVNDLRYDITLDGILGARAHIRILQGAPRDIPALPTLRTWM